MSSIGQSSIPFLPAGSTLLKRVFKFVLSATIFSIGLQPLALLAGVRETDDAPHVVHHSRMEVSLHSVTRTDQSGNEYNSIQYNSAIVPASYSIATTVASDQPAFSGHILPATLARLYDHGYDDASFCAFAECFLAPRSIGEVGSAAKKYVTAGEHATSFARPPKGWRYFVQRYKPKFFNHKIIPSPSVLRQTAKGRKILAHEMQHMTDAIKHPEFFYFSRISRAPGAGIGHVIMETRGYLQSHGLRALWPGYAMRSVQGAGRAGLVYRDLAILGGLGAAGAGTASYLSE